MRRSSASLGVSVCKDSFESFSTKRKVLSDNEYETDSDSITSNALIKPNGHAGPRQKRRTASARQTALEADIWTLEVEKGRVQCKGCRKWIQLNKKQDYNDTNWKAHKSKCERVAGFQRKRTMDMKGPALLAVSGRLLARSDRYLGLTCSGIRRQVIHQ